MVKMSAIYDYARAVAVVIAFIAGKQSKKAAVLFELVLTAWFGLACLLFPKTVVSKVRVPTTQFSFYCALKHMQSSKSWKIKTYIHYFWFIMHIPIRYFFSSRFLEPLIWRWTVQYSIREPASSVWPYFSTCVINQETIQFLEALLYQKLW